MPTNVTASDIQLENDLPTIPDRVWTDEAIFAEARALGPRFTEVTAPPSAIVTDAEEMLAGEEDLPAFAAGGYPVTANHFDRMRRLKAMLVPRSAARERGDELRKRYTEQAAGRRDTLLEVRARIARQARAARLPSALFSLGKVNTTRLSPVLWRTDEVLDNAATLRERFANKAKIDQLLASGRSLVDTIKSERAALGLQSSLGVEETRLQQQLERLLVDTMRFVGAQGLACFDEDATRDARYRLDHVYARRVNDADVEDEPELPEPTVAPADA